MARNGSDLLVEGLIEWGIDTIFGMPGDGINGVMEAIRTHSDKVRFVQVRHEESAALMACGYAKWTGKLGCCLATTGPGGIHLLNGLYDAKFDRAPVVALTGLPYHDLIDTFTQQDVDHNKLFADVAVYTTRIMSAAHVENAVALACRSALAQAGVAHLAIPTDVQEEQLDEQARSPRNVAHHASYAQTSGGVHLPESRDLERAVQVLQAGRKIAILAGRGALGARDELLETAHLLGAPIVKALLGKAVVPDDHPLTTGGIGLLGTRPSQEVFEECDTLLIVGSTFPYVEYYPKPNQARGVQIDTDASRIGLRFPVEVGLVGDAQQTLQLLNSRLSLHPDRSFLERAQASKRQWVQLLNDSADRQDVLSPGMLARELGEHLADDAIVAWDSGHNTGVLARYTRARGKQMYAGSGMMATMACAVPYAIAAALAYPGRQVVAFTGDGGLTMLLGELATIVRYRLPIKVIVMKNNTLGQIKWEQLMFLGNPEYECDLQPIDFVKVAEGMGIRAMRIGLPAECGTVLQRALAADGPVLVEAPVDPNEPLLPPKRMPKYAENLEKALEKGTPGAEQIRAALDREPYRTQLRP